MSTRLTSSRARPPTSSRPISSRKGAGYNTGGLTTSGGKKVISPLDHVAESFSQFLKDTTDSPESKIKEFKKNIAARIQESANLIRKGENGQEALLKAKEAEKEMKGLQDLITQKSIDDGDFKAVKFTVMMQLANAYKINAMWEDALHSYQRILKDREFASPQIVYLEIGNVFLKQAKYEDAIKNYEMGINHLTTDMSRLMARFNQNCGIAQVALGDYHRALSSFETAMRQDPSIKTGYNLVLCHSVLSSVDELKEAFTRLLTVRPHSSFDMSNSDVLGNQLHIERREEVRLVMLAARLVASKSTVDWQESYEFVLQQLKKSKFPEASGEFEIAYSLAHLHHKNATKAIEMLRSIRRKDPQLMALAATNLSFLYFLEEDYDNADKYATIALDHDKYNAQALVNKGNCLMHNDRLEEARDTYLEAVGVEAGCVEALYNLGLASKLMGAYDEALQVFQKLNRLIPKSSEVVFEISDCYERIGMIPQAIDWLHRLINLLPTDPAVWRRLGGIWDADGNETQAFHCYSESFKFCPSDIEVISWLGTYFRHQQHYDNALKFFERAAALAPKEPRYPLMVASCLRYMDCKPEALEVYERVIHMDPMNRQCLEHLVKITSEMGLTAKADQYQYMLRDVMEQTPDMDDDIGVHPESVSRVPNAMSGTTAMDAMQYSQEPVESPSLRMGGAGQDMVQTAVAGGREDIWDGMDDIDLGD